MTERHLPTAALDLHLAPAAPTRLGFAALLLLGVSIGLVFPGLSSTPFLSKGEPREALVVQSVVAGPAAAVIIPRRPSSRGWEVASKPPFFHWLAALPSAARGTVTEGTARLPSALLATLLVLATGWVGTRAFGRTAGVWAGLVLASSPEWLHAASTARVDATLACTVGAALLAALELCSGARPRPRLTWAIGVATGLAVLAKGPVGLVLVAPPLALLWALDRGRATWARPRDLLAAGLVAGLIGIAWYVAATWVGGREFFEKQILHENLYRFLPGAPDRPASHPHGPLYYLGALATGFFPWSLALFLLVVATLRDRRALADRRVLLLATFVAWGLFFHSVATGKRAVYILPLYPALALLVGLGVARIWEGREPPGPRWLALALARVPAVIAGAAFGLLILQTLGLDTLALVAPFLHPTDRANLGLVRQILTPSVPLAAVALVGLACATDLVRVAGARRWRRVTVDAALLAGSILALSQHVVRPPFARARSFAPFAGAIVARVPAGAALCGHPGSFDFGLWFYLGRDVEPCPVDADRRPPDTVDWVLIFDRSWWRLPADTRERWTPVVASEATRGHGRTRFLLLARRPPAPFPDELPVTPSAALGLEVRADADGWTLRRDAGDTGDTGVPVRARVVRAGGTPAPASAPAARPSLTKRGALRIDGGPAAGAMLELRLLDRNGATSDVRLALPDRPAAAPGA